MIFLKQIDKASSYIPLVSSVTNIVDLVIKGIMKVFLSDMKFEKGSYFYYLNKKSFYKCAALSIPVLGNLGVYIYTQSQWKDKQFAIEAIKQKPSRIKNINSKLFADREVAIIALAANPKLLTDPRFKRFDSQEAFILEIVKINPEIINYLSLCRNDPRFMLDCLKQNKKTCLYLSEDMKKDPSFFREALNLEGISYSDLHPHCSKLSGFNIALFVTQAARKCPNQVFENFDDHLKNNERLMRSLFLFIPFSTLSPFLTPEMREKKLFVSPLEEIPTMPKTHSINDLLKEIQFYKKEFAKNNRPYLEALIAAASPSLLENPEFIELCSSKGYNLLTLLRSRKDADNFYKNKEFVKIFAKMDPSTIIFCSSVPDYEAFILEIAKTHPEVILYINETLKYQREFMLACLKSNKATFKHINDPMKRDLDFLLGAIQREISYNDLLPYSTQLSNHSLYKFTIAAAKKYPDQLFANFGKHLMDDLNIMCRLFCFIPFSTLKPFLTPSIRSAKSICLQREDEKHLPIQTQTQYSIDECLNEIQFYKLKFAYQLINRYYYESLIAAAHPCLLANPQFISLVADNNFDLTRILAGLSR